MREEMEDSNIEKLEDRKKTIWIVRHPCLDDSTSFSEINLFFFFFSI